MARNGLRQFVGCQGIVYTRDDDRAIRGVLTAVHRDCVVLANGVQYIEKGQTVDVPGEVAVPIGNVSWFNRTGKGGVA